LLLAANLVNSPGFGLLAMEAGISQGWSNLKDNNHNPAYNLNFRYRTPDMRTWIDFASMFGNSQADPGKIDFPAGASSRWFADRVNVPITMIISPRGQMRSQFDLFISHHFTPALKMVLEFTAGRQKGDGAMDTISLLTGPGFKGASWGGLNLMAQYRISPSLSLAARVETFRDRDGLALFPNSSTPSDFTEATLGIQYFANRYIQFRPEVRYDRQSHNNDQKAFGRGTRDHQASFNADMVIRY
jgi:hypothetical protein